MNKEAFVAQNQHDVSRTGLVVRSALNGEQIARPQRGKHARSPYLQANGAVAAKNLGRKTKFSILASFQHGCHGWQQDTRHSGGICTENQWVGLCRKTAPESRKPSHAGMQ